MEKMNFLQIDPMFYRDTILSAEEILSWFDQEDAYWMYQGEPSPGKAHAELASGDCSNGYFDVSRLLRYPNVAEILGRQLGEQLRKRLECSGTWEVGWVISSAYSAITFGHEVAKELNAIFMNTERDPTNAKKQIWQRQTIPADAIVLQIEELVTTTQTLDAVRKAVVEGNRNDVKILSVVGTGVLRPPELLNDYDGITIEALVPVRIQNFKPEECPYCAAGSPRYKPKMNWEKLTGKG